MKNRKSTITLAATLTVLSQTASAQSTEGSGRYYELSRTTLKHGFHARNTPGSARGVTGLSELEISQHGTLLKELNTLIDRLENKKGSVFGQTNESGETRIVGSRWRAYLDASGSKGRVVRDDRTLPGEPNIIAIPPSELEKKGRQFLAEFARNIISHGEHERLVVWRTGEETGESESVQESAPEKTVYESYIVFSREFDGIDVIGPGSKAVVSFDQAGNVREFAFDWPKLGRGKRLSTLSSRSIADSLNQTLARKRIDIKGATPTYSHCGYYDPGAENRVGSISILPGCLFGYEFRSSQFNVEGESFAFDIIIPGVKSIPKDNDFWERIQSENR